MSDSHEMDRKLDGWLADWPVPERSDREWEEFGSKLDERLSGLTIGHGDDAWLQPPLPDQPGEGDREKLLAGGVSMSERNSERPPKKSLKDFAPVSYTHLTLPTNYSVYVPVVAVSLKKIYDLHDEEGRSTISQSL